MSSEHREEDGFHRDSTGKILPTIENFYKFCADRRLMGVKCRKCGAIFALPRATCQKCHSTGMDWVQLKGNGKLLSYSIVYVATPEYQDQTPYAVGIVGLEEGTRLSGVIKNVKHEDLRVGLDLIVDFEETTSQEWPQWPKYFFRTP